MASVTRCVGCGNKAILAKRRALNTVASASILSSLKHIFFWWFEARNVGIKENELDSFLRQSFLCRPCYYAYESYSKKQMELLKALGNSEKLKNFDTQATPVVEPEPPSKRLRHDAVSTPSRSISQEHQPSTIVSVSIRL